jgi:superfamily II DNA or RNA helicase
MKENQFQKLNPIIDDNTSLRIPQRGVYEAIKNEYEKNADTKEVGIVLPVGCGKSGCITITPFALKSVRTLVVAPNLSITKQLYNDFYPSNTKMFYQKCHVLNGDIFPEPAEIRGDKTNLSDLEVADVVITNIQQLQGDENQWLNGVSDDFFDLIIFDEAHHNVASTWENLRQKFPNAHIVNYSATPIRADGQVMSGNIIYSFPVVRAIEAGYIKRLKAKVLNPTTLKYVLNDGKETEVSLDEVIRMGEDDSDFRKSIVTSKETRDTIVNVSINELERIRTDTNDNRHKIIASALNYAHCNQIVQAYRERGKRADFVHSRADSKANETVYKKLENNELDVIVQVRKLGEGFDHKYLSVAAVFSIFATVSPFIQFVGRIMRVIEEGNPNSILNQGTVIFHAGSNIQNRWTDFQYYSQADRSYFQNLLPMEGLAFSDNNEIEIIPPSYNFNTRNLLIKEQSGVSLEEIPLIDNDPIARQAIEYLRNKNYSEEQKKIISDYLLRPVPTTKQIIRQAERSGIDDKIKTTVGMVLARHKLLPKGKDLDRTYLKDNFVFVKSEIDKAVNRSVGMVENERKDFTQEQFDQISANYDGIITEMERKLFNGKK